MRPIFDSKVSQHPKAAEQRLRGEYRELKQRIAARREAEMDDIVNRDLRPEGPLLLEAAMSGALDAAKFIAIRAVKAGYSVTMDTVQKPNLRGINLITITTLKENF